MTVDMPHFFSRDQFTTFLKYATVGTSGTLIDVGGFALLVHHTPLNRFVAAALTFILAVINNYVWNRRWTYRDRSTKVREQFPKFVLVSLGGLLLNLIAFWFIGEVLLFLLPYFSTTLSSSVLPPWGATLAKLGASGMVLIYNFIMNTWWTFKKPAFESEI